MREDASLKRVGELLRHQYHSVPRPLFWKAVAGAIAVALAVVIPLSALLLFHEGPWTGFAWDLLIRLPFAVVGIALVLVAVRQARAGQRKALPAFALVVLAFALVTGLAGDDSCGRRGAWLTSAALPESKSAPWPSRATRPMTPRCSTRSPPTCGEPSGIRLSHTAGRPTPASRSASAMATARSIN